MLTYVDRKDESILLWVQLKTWRNDDRDRNVNWSAMMKLLRRFFKNMIIFILNLLSLKGKFMTNIYVHVGTTSARRGGFLSRERTTIFCRILCSAQKCWHFCFKLTQICKFDANLFLPNWVLNCVKLNVWLTEAVSLGMLRLAWLYSKWEEWN